MEGNLRSTIDWASLIVGRTLTFLLCFTLYLRASKYKLPWSLYLDGRIKGGFFFAFWKGGGGGLIVGGAYFRNFTVCELEMYFKK